MAQGIQNKLTKVRPPRVAITYDLEVNGATEKKEIPFLMGVLGNFSGHTHKSVKKLKNSKFINVDKETFSAAMQDVNPTLKFSVADKIKGEEGGSLNVDIKFASMEDFTPGNIAKNVPELNKLLETRRKLVELQSKIDGNDKLEAIMLSLVKHPDALKSIAAAGESPAGESPAGESPKADDKGGDQNGK